MLVTSEVTFVPGNYIKALQGAAGSGHVSAIILLRNFSWTFVLQATALYLLGCRRFAATLLKNILSLRRDPRVKLFKSQNLPVLYFNSMNDPAAISWVRNNQIDLIVNMRTRCIYRREILQAPRLGCINIHHGLLPEARGTMCDLYALAEERPAGFSIHEMTTKVDAGKILSRTIVSDSEKDYIRYLDHASLKEGDVLQLLLRQIAETGLLPQGLENQSLQKVYRRNPDRATIRQMLAKGIIL